MTRERRGLETCCRSTELISVTSAVTAGSGPSPVTGTSEGAIRVARVRVPATVLPACP